MTFGKIIEDRDGVSFIEEQLGANAADVPGAADHENFHRASCRAVARDVKANKRSASGLLLEPGDHPPDEAIFFSRIENLEALLFRTPLNHVDIDVAHPPLPHRGPARLVKID